VLNLVRLISVVKNVETCVQFLAINLSLHTFQLSRKAGVIMCQESRLLRKNSAWGLMTEKNNFVYLYL